MIETEEKSWRLLRRKPFVIAQEFVNKKRGESEFHLFVSEAINKACDTMMIENTGWTAEEFMLEEHDRLTDKAKARNSRYSSINSTCNGNAKCLSRSERFFYAKQSLSWILPNICRSVRRAYIALVRGRVQND